MQSNTIAGFHHLTAIVGNPQQNVDFYTHVLGQRLIKQTVNFDDPTVYHLYFGNDEAKPGTLITFFEWPHLEPGRWGIGATHHLAFIVETDEAQLKWKRRLIDNGIEVTGPYDRHFFHSIYFSDPDGLILEIATRGPGWAVDGSQDDVYTPPVELTRFGRDENEIAKRIWPEPVEDISADMKLSGLHHITAISSDIQFTSEFYQQLLGFRLLKRSINFDDPTAPHYYFGIDEGQPGTIITYFGYPPDRMRYGQIGVGLTHHFAFAVEDEESQLRWRSKLLKADISVTPVLDRQYFKSIYFQDPDGHILEIATLGPGFFIDEDKETLGKNLRLPKWLEPQRKQIEESLTPIT